MHIDASRDLGVTDENPQSSSYAPLSQKRKMRKQSQGSRELELKYKLNVIIPCITTSAPAQLKNPFQYKHSTRLFCL